MKKLFKLSTLFLITATIFINGCGKSEEKKSEISLERSKLILRLFDSLENEDYNSALIQARKLREINSKNIYLINAIETCTINITIEKINALIKENKIKEAYSLLKNLNATYPLNEKVQKDLSKMESILKNRK